MRLKFGKLKWLLNKNSKLSLDNKRLIYKSIIKPIWTYGVPILGTAKKVEHRVNSKTTVKNSKSYYKCSILYDK